MHMLRKQKERLVSEGRETANRIRIREQGGGQPVGSEENGQAEATASASHFSLSLTEAEMQNFILKFYFLCKPKNPFSGKCFP